MADDDLDTPPAVQDDALAAIGARAGITLAGATARAAGSALGDAIDTPGTMKVAQERYRQQVVGGHTIEHDALQDEGQLMDAARCYLEAAMDEAAGVKTDGDYVPDSWPWGAESWKPKTGAEGAERMLVKAGALIAAELDRLAYARAVRAMSGGREQ